MASCLKSLSHIYNRFSEMFWKFDLFTLPPTLHVTIYFYVRRKDFIGFEYWRVFSLLFFRRGEVLDLSFQH